MYKLKKVFISLIIFSMFFSLINQPIVLAAGSDPKNASEIKIGDVIQTPIEKEQPLWFKITPTSSVIAEKSHLILETRGNLDTGITFYSDLQNALENKSYYVDDDNGERGNAKLIVPLAWKGPFYIKLESLTPGQVELITSVTFIAPEDHPDGGACAAEVAVETKPESKQTLTMMRSLRDGLLTRTEVGRKLTSLYYQASPYLVFHLVNDHSFRGTVYEGIQRMEPILYEILMVANGRDSSYVVTIDDYRSFDKLRKEIGAHLPDYLSEQLESSWEKLNVNVSIVGKEIDVLLEEAKLIDSMNVDKFSSKEIIVKLKRKGKNSRNSQGKKAMEYLERALRDVGYKDKSVRIKPMSTKKNDSLFQNTFVLELKKTENIDRLLNELAKKPDIEYAQPNYIYHALTKDVYYKYQWPLENTGQDGGTAGKDIGYTQLSKILAGKQLKSTLIAVVDTGINYTLADFSDRIRVGKDFVNDDEDAMDDNDHGTHVAGVIAAASDNGHSIAGINQYTELLPVKVLEEDGRGYTDDVARGIQYAVDQGAKVINLSLGMEDFDQTIEEALRYASEKNVTVFAAAGNKGKNKLIYPASSQYVISVGAIDNQDKKTSFSNYGEGLDVVAPGMRVPSLVQNGNVLYANGTSMATPHASAIAGLIYSLKPDITPKKIEELLQKNSDDLGDPGYDEKFGWGKVNAAKIVSSVLGDSITANVEQIRLKVGESFQIEVTANQKGKVTNVTKQTKWSVKDKKIAAIKNGIVKGMSLGNTEIVGKYKNMTLRIPIHVRTPVPVGGTPLFETPLTSEMLTFSQLAYSNLDEYIPDRFHPEGWAFEDIVGQENWEYLGLTEFVSEMKEIYGQDYLKPLEEIKNWRVIAVKNDIKSGFYGVAFQNGENIVIAFRGTEEKMDWKMDVLLLFRIAGPQLAPAREFIQEVSSQNIGKKITITGHSLGGWLSQKISVEMVEKDTLLSNMNTFVGSVTFNAPAFAKDSIWDPDYITEEQWEKNQKGQYNNWVVNYVISDDAIGAGNFFCDHIGRTIILPFLSGEFIKYPYSKKKGRSYSIDLEAHSIKNFYFMEFSEGNILPSIKDDELYGSGPLRIPNAFSGDYNGRDWFDGGEGNDKYWGGLNNDTYIFREGYGRDQLTDYGGIDTIETDVVKDQLSFQKVGDHLVIRFNVDEQLTCTNFFATSFMYDYRIEFIKFKDGSIIPIEHLLNEHNVK